MTQYGFYFDSNRCTGCRTCEMACKDYRDLPPNYAYRRVFDYEGGSWIVNEDGTYVPNVFAYHLSMACNHCEQPSCMQLCPQGAIVKDENTGLVAIDQEVCNGSGVCVEACPFKVPVLDTTLNKGVKCDGCGARLAEGKNPICVDACPLRALEFGDIEELRALHGETVSAIAPMASPDMTHPSLAIDACPAAKEPEDDTGYISNFIEVANVD